jgi:hypothetical protein
MKDEILVLNRNIHNTSILRNISLETYYTAGYQRDLRTTAASSMRQSVNYIQDLSTGTKADSSFDQIEL